MPPDCGCEDGNLLKCSESHDVPTSRVESIDSELPLKLGALPRTPEARESLMIARLNWVLKRLASVLVAGFEAVEPVISVAGFGLTSIFVFPWKWSMLANTWISGSASLMGVLQSCQGFHKLSLKLVLQ